MAESIKQLKKEIAEKLEPAIETLVVEKESPTAEKNAKQLVRKESVHIDRDDLRKFLNAISIENIECVGHSILDESKIDEKNQTGKGYQFEGHPSRKGKQQKKAGIKIVGTAKFPTAAGGGTAEAEVIRTKQYSEKPKPVPARTRRVSKQSTELLMHKLTLAVQADYLIRGYSHKPVKQGAAIGGGTGAALGAAGGIAAGAVVPGIGHIVGAVVGGIIGIMAAGGAGAGVGAGGGAIHSNRFHTVVQSCEVFAKLPDFSTDNDNNICRCVIRVNSMCPVVYQSLQSCNED